MLELTMLKKGDICPCCGEPIETDDPVKLAWLSGYQCAIEQEAWIDAKEEA